MTKEFDAGWKKIVMENSKNICELKKYIKTLTRRQKALFNFTINRLPYLLRDALLPFSEIKNKEELKNLLKQKEKNIDNFGERIWANVQYMVSKNLQEQLEEEE